MKKLYTLVGAVLVSGMAVAQSGSAPLKEAQSIMHAGQKSELREANAGIQYGISAQRSTLWTETFGSGSQGNLPTGWTANIVQGSVPWEWTDVGHTGAYPTAALTSSSAADGWMIADSDLYGTQGGNQEEADLTSPVVDLSGNPAVSLTFEQMFREFNNDVTTVSITTDGGTTWTDWVINDGVGQGGTPNPDLQSINVTTAIQGNPANVQVRFKWEGVWDYGWQIDDVCFVTTANDDMMLAEAEYKNANVYSTGTSYPRYTVMPIAHIQPIQFRGSTKNNGANAQTNVVINGSVDGVNAGVGAFTGSSATYSSAPAQVDSVVLNGTFTPAGIVDQFTVNFDVDYDNIATEDSPGDLTATSSFEVTDYDWGKDDNDYDGQGLWNGDDGNGISNAFEMCNTFQFQAADQVQGVSVILTGSTDPGVILYASLYEDDGTAFNLINTSAGTADEHTVTANDISAVGDIRWVYMPVNTTISGQMDVLACLGHYGGPDAAVIGNGHYTAEQQVVFILDGTDNTWYYMTSTPALRIHLAGSSVGVENDESGKLVVSQNMPNPFDNTSTIGYFLNEAANVSLEIVDMTGKVVYAENMGTKVAGNHSINLDAADFSAGMYYYTFTADDVRVSKKMIITK